DHGCRRPALSSRRKTAQHHNSFVEPAGLADGLALKELRFHRSGFAPNLWVPRSPPMAGIRHLSGETPADCYDGCRDNPAPSDQLSVVAIRLKRRVPAVLLAIVTCAATACGNGGLSTGKSVESVKSDRYVPRIGRGPRYRFPPASRNVAGAVPVGALHCARSRAARVG